MGSTQDVDYAAGDQVERDRMNTLLTAVNIELTAPSTGYNCNRTIRRGDQL